MKHKYYLRQLTICLFVSLIVFTANAQKKHFVYLQSEDKQPFFVMLNNKNYSSSMSGYLVISKLKPGRYFFTAGFPKDIYQEQKFSIVIEDGKDMGYALKRFGDKGWGLFDYVTFNTIMANPSDWEKDKSVYDTVKLNTDDAFNAQPIRQQVAKTIETTASTIGTKQTETAVTETKPPVAEVVNTVSPPPIKNEIVEKPVINKVETSPVYTPQSNNRYQIVKTYDKNSYQGIDQVYIDYTPTKNDTITVFIPYYSYQQTNTATSTEVADTSKPYNAGFTNQYNRSCVNLATETDFARTRKLMSYETTDDKMTSSAKKSFKDKCYTTEQIQKLGLLYLSEQSRCKFFIMSKPFIYDVFNYPSLETAFSVSSTIEQFRKSTN